MRDTRRLCLKYQKIGIVKINYIYDKAKIFGEWIDNNYVIVTMLFTVHKIIFLDKDKLSGREPSKENTYLFGHLGKCFAG